MTVTMFFQFANEQQIREAYVAIHAITCIGLAIAANWVSRKLFIRKRGPV